MFDKQQICLNGRFISGETKNFYAENRGFLYGDSLFETMFVSKGKIHFLDEHLDRLYYGMKVLKYEVPTVFTGFKRKLEEEIFSLIAKNKNYKSSAVRLSVFRNSGGLYTPERNNFSYVISTRELNNVFYELNTSGLFTDLYNEIRKPFNLLSSFKSGNSLIYTLGGIFRKENELDDCLLCNEKGNIIESLSSNIFLIKGEKLITPSIQEGCVDGIIRKQILKFCDKFDIPNSVQNISPELMYEADEVFLTNSINGIRWVVAYKEKRYFKKHANFFTNKLNELFR